MVSKVAYNITLLSDAPRKKYQSPDRLIIQELKQKYESQVSESSMKSEPKSHKTLTKFKVKQIVAMFNSKISQSNTLTNELAAEQATLPKPRTRYTKDLTAVPSPRLNSKKPICFIDDDVKDKLTVKDKALLYTQFVDDMLRKTPTIAMESTLTREIARGEVVNEKQVSVKRLLEDLEARCVFPKHTISPMAAQRLSDAVRGQNRRQLPLGSPVKSKVFKDIVEQKLSHLSIHYKQSQHEASELNTLKKTAPIIEIEHSKESLLGEKEADANQIKINDLELVMFNNSPLSKICAPAVTHQHLTKSVSSESSTSSLSKQSAREQIQSGISILPKLCSFNMQVNREARTDIKVCLLQYYHENQDQIKSSENKQKYFNLTKPLKPMRKKKYRRTLAWKMDRSLGETNTTDSETDCRSAKKTVSKRQALEHKSITCETSIVASPRKIKLDYTLTVSSPSANKRREALSGARVTLYSNIYEENKQPAAQSLADSFDQGFETGSNEMDSPRRQPPSLFNKIFMERGADPYQTTTGAVQNISETPSSFSTPIKKQGQHNLSSAFNDSGIKQQLFSPISKPDKIYDSESTRTAIAMQDHPGKRNEIQSSHDMNSADVFLAPNVSRNASSYWIKSGDFFIAFDIYKVDLERVKLLNEIFSQRSCDTNDIVFGIDDHKFSVNANSKDEENILKRLPQNKETSHYWFSTGDLVIPFSGKLLTSDKIQRIFLFIKASVEETGVLRFGVDEVEFSTACSYSLQAGNDLEERYQFTRSLSKPDSHLDQLDFESDDFVENESISPCSNSIVQLATISSQELMIARNSEAVATNPKSLCKAYTNEPWEHYLKTATVPRMIKTAETKQPFLYNNTATISCDALDALKGTPEYTIQLKNIVSDISNIGCSSDFKDTSLEELERYMFFLSCYLDICLNNYNSHKDNSAFL